ncbi:stress-induced-phospho 1 [Chlorella sorokiniana]|uniref:Stress-induced-phospho 1 n=1 Tax=Chlorella sorokiniana TaxID=3076 RepID=A0A2P6TGT2_CHLSO|nr:stress-induced-phospho 1 [Chlorella sorokiniana]|eukprot:PRW33332.1 stress-induced-phospho 1 [Chlorella sorokiniana]
MAEAARSQGVPPEPRASFLTDPFTSRDLFGVCRGRCLQCTDCGKYLKATADYTVNSIDQGRRHPDNDPSITRCSRCGCPPEAHEVAEHEQERELGNDAFALRRYDAAIAHYSRALGMCSTDAALWSNRAAAYLAKGWPQQALHDAEHALALRPDWPKAWGRKAAALLQLGRPAAAVEAYQRALQLEQGQGETSGGSAALRHGLRQAQAALAKQQRAAQPAKPRQPQQPPQQQPQAPKASPAPSAAPPKTGRRAPKPAQAAGAADGGLSSLRQMCADAEAAAMAVDSSGTPRAACKQCGDSRCPCFRPAGTLSEAELAAVLAQQAAANGGFSKPDACTICGCPSSVHETPREFATRQARERRQRLRAQRQASGTASSVAGASAAAAAASKESTFQPEALDDRQRRVAAAAQRRAEAEATGDVLQDSDCDMLTQQRRTTCGGCSACPGFRLLFRGCDANDPEVMFYCSACGCRSDQHAVDSEWQRHEEARRAAEAAASERRQAAAAGGGAAAVAARKAEAEAFATLGLSLGADAKSINRAYKRLALQLHPDKQQRASRAEAEAAAARFVRVAEAYKLLSGS